MVSRRPSERPLLGAARVPVFIAGQDDAVILDVSGSSIIVTDIPLTTVTGTYAAAGDNEIVGTPGAGNRIVVVAFVIQNESATATTMILRNGATSAWRCLGQNQGDGLSKTFTLARPWKLAPDTALNLNLSGANQCGYSVMYYVEAV